jgi:hypothetical protein
MKTSRFALFAVLGGLAVLSSCAKDQDQEQYEREETQRRLNIYNSISGTYNGESRSQWNSADAKFRIELWSELRTVPGAGTREAQDRPELLAKVYFAGEVQTTLVFRNASFDESKRVLNAETTIKRLDGILEPIKLKATVTDSGIQGTIGTLDYFEYGYKFEISKTNESEPFNWPEVRREGQIPRVIELEGKADWGTMTNRQAKLSLMMTTGEVETQLLSLLSPVRRIRGAIGFDYDTITLSYPVLVWDSRVGQITGEGSTNSSGDVITYTIDCIENRRADQPRFSVGDLDCSQVVSTRGTIAKFRFPGNAR